MSKQHNNGYNRKYLPPNTTQISENFFADKTEMSNLGYKEYLYDLQKYYGTESDIYKAAYPDTSVWIEDNETGIPLIKNYFNHYKYDYFPVVGVTLSQAKAYTNWRTEKVIEMQLLTRGLVQVNYSSDVGFKFSVKKYLAGEYLDEIKREIILVPQYSIPTIEEWELIAGINSDVPYGTNEQTRFNKKVKKDFGSTFNVQSTQNSKNFPKKTNTLSKNIYGLHGLIGNVAELVDSNDIVKGGSWQHTIKMIKENDIISGPKNWVGFRNVCSLKMIDELENP